MPQFVLYIPERRIRVSTRGGVWCPHNRLAVKYLSRTPDNFNRSEFLLLSTPSRRSSRVTLLMIQVFLCVRRISMPPQISPWMELGMASWMEYVLPGLLGSPPHLSLVWQDELICALEDAYVDDELIDIVEALPARLSARTQAEIHAQFWLSSANPGGYS